MKTPEEPGIGTGRSRKIAFSAVVLVLFFLGLETIVRGWVFYLREDYERYDPESGTFILIPGVYRAQGNLRKINQDGFVGSELQEPGPDLWRVVALGDSNTFGAGNASHTYPARFEQLLREEAPDRLRVEVVNAGVEGMDSANALRRLRSKVVELDPQVITVYIGWNDLMKFDPIGQDRSNRFAGVSRAIDSLWTVKGFRKLVFLKWRPYYDPPATGSASHTGRFEYFNPSDFTLNLHQIVGEIRSSGAEPVVMTLATVVRENWDVEDLRKANVFFPYYPSAYGVGDFLTIVDRYNDAIREISRGLSVPIVDLNREFAGRKDYRAMFFDTMHPTDLGQESIAREMLATFRENDLLPKLRGD